MVGSFAYIQNVGLGNILLLLLVLHKLQWPYNAIKCQTVLQWWCLNWIDHLSSIIFPNVMKNFSWWNRYVSDSLTITLDPNPPVINKLVSETDISFPSVGIPVKFKRTYLLDSDFDGPMGYGWTHNYRMRLVIPTALLPATTGELLPVLPPVQVFNAADFKS